jgi:uncharacterized membrane protein
VRTLSPPWRRVVVGSWVVVLVLSVATTTLYVDNKRTKECIGGYMVADTAGAKVRFGVAEQERQAFKGMLRSIATEPDPQIRSQRILEHVKLLDDNDAVRKANPIREVPTECD